MNELVAYKSLVVAVILLLLFLAERVVPAVPAPAGIASATRLSKNLGLWVCNLFASVLIVLPVTLFATSHSHYWWSAWVPSWSWLLLDLLLLDLWIYWWHRASHRIGFLWRFHRVHHLDQWLDGAGGRDRALIVRMRGEVHQGAGRLLLKARRPL